MIVSSFSNLHLYISYLENMIEEFNELSSSDSSKYVKVLSFLYSIKQSRNIKKFKLSLDNINSIFKELDFNINNLKSNLFIIK
jgi:hypothetical protein